MTLGYPNVVLKGNEPKFRDGRFCPLPKPYIKPTNKIKLKEFYSTILGLPFEEIKIGVDPLGFTFIILDFICYVGIVSRVEKKSVYNSLKKKFPQNVFDIEYIQKQIHFEYDLLNFKEYIPIDIVTQNLHEIRGLNSKISGNIDIIMNIESESEWESSFDQQNETVKKIYVGSRLIKFILDNIKFYIPNFFENLNLDYTKSFIAHRSVSKIVKIYRNDFKKDRADIDFKGYSTSTIKGDKEYFEILIKILIENALKYSEFPKKIGPKVLIRENKFQIEIQVHSYGRSIPVSERNHLFIRGFRSTVNSHNKEGTGMGLYNAKQLALKFNSDIEFSCNEISDNEEIDLAWNIFTLRLKI